MAEIKWETEVRAAMTLAEKSHRPIFLDFWFDG